MEMNNKGKTVIKTKKTINRKGSQTNKKQENKKQKTSGEKKKGGVTKSK